jgi:branched-chain amino acid transport system substrate-binding protein
LIEQQIFKFFGVTMLAPPGRKCEQMTSDKRVRRGLIAFVVAALAVTLTGAGSSASAAEAAHTPILVGNIGSYSGVEASSQTAAPIVLKAWSSWVNAHGGLNGHPVELIVKDIGADPSGGLAAVKELVEQDHVVAIVGEEDNNDSTWASYVASTGVPVIGGQSLDLPFMTNPDFYPVGTNIFADIYGQELLAKKLGPKLGLLYCAESPQCAGIAPITRLIATSTGLQVPVSVEVSATAPNYTAACEQLKSAGVRTYSIADNSAVVLRIAHECALDGLKATPIGGDGAITTAWLKEPAANGGLDAELDLPFFDNSISASKEMQQAIKKYAPNLNGLNEPVGMYAWVSGKLLEKAVSAIPAGVPITPQSIKTGLYTLKGQTLGGLTPPLTFTPGKPAIINCYFVAGIAHGMFTEPQGIRTSCAPDAVVNKVLKLLPKN